MGAAKRMNRRRRCLLSLTNESGGAHILVLALLALGCLVVIAATALNAAMTYSMSSGIKPLLDAATHAAALEFDPVQASYGRIVWDSSGGTEAFYHMLRLNLELDDSNQPLVGSPLVEAPVVHRLAYVDATGYPFDYHDSVTVEQGTPQETTRSIHVRVYGPSVVAILEVKQAQLAGEAAEPVVLSSVSSIRLRER